MKKGLHCLKLLKRCVDVGIRNKRKIPPDHETDSICNFFLLAGIEQKSCFSYAKRCTKVSFQHIFVFL